MTNQASNAQDDDNAAYLPYGGLFGLIGAITLFSSWSEGFASLSPGTLLTIILGLCWPVFVVLVLRPDARRSRSWRYALVGVAWVIAVLSLIASVYAVSLVFNHGATIEVSQADVDAISNPRSRRGAWVVRFLPLLLVFFTASSFIITVREALQQQRVLARR